jgi:hypothetical protein
MGTVDRRRVFAALAGVMAWVGRPAAAARDAGEPCACDHIVWAGKALERMQTIKASMTRDQLLEVFTVEGGLSTALQRTFVSRDCPYFKVEVRFRHAAERKIENREEAFLSEYGDDVIVTISKPYMEFSIAD